jgi:hypothetical protein
MAQFARPDADLNVGGFENEAAGTTNLFQSIDEAVASDSDFVVSDPLTDPDVYVCSLSPLEDPLTSSGHVVRYRYQKSASGGAQVNLTVELRQGYVDEGTQGTLIASQSHTDIPATPTAGEFTLTAVEADAITNYADLALRFVSDQV